MLNLNNIDLVLVRFSINNDNSRLMVFPSERYFLNFSRRLNHQKGFKGLKVLEFYTTNLMDFLVYGDYTRGDLERIACTIPLEDIGYIGQVSEYRLFKQAIYKNTGYDLEEGFWTDSTYDDLDDDF